jgi:two-component system cell cycle response regulator CtrA
MVSKESFLNHLYGGIHEPQQKNIDVFIRKLRKKLASTGNNLIETVWAAATCCVSRAKTARDSHDAGLAL